MTVVAMAGTGAGAAAAAAGGGTPQLSADWVVDLRTVLTVGGVVLPATWWLSRAFTAITDRLNASDRRFMEMERVLARMEDRLEKLPCRKCSGMANDDE